MLNKQQILDLLQKNDKSIGRALIVLSERQTMDEQSSEQTRYNNGVGFTPADARMGTSMASFFKFKGYLSPKQLSYWKRPNKKGVPRICKYAGQLLEIAQEKVSGH